MEGVESPAGHPILLESFIVALVAFGIGQEVVEPIEEERDDTSP